MRRRFTPAERAAIARIPLRAETYYAKALRGLANSWLRNIIEYVGPTFRAQRTDAKTVPGQLELARAENIARLPLELRRLHKRMAVSLNEDNARYLGIATEVTSEFRNSLTENLRLLSKAENALGSDAIAILSNPDNFGLRWEEVAKQLEERGDVSANRAELIARDQTLKLNADITRARQQGAGVTQYIWSTSLDNRVRDEHSEREGQIFEWSSPPEDGHPGEAILCRCVAIPLVPEIDDPDL